MSGEDHLVLCSQCAYPMELVDIREAGPADPNDTSQAGPWFFAGASFECTHCDQHATVRPDGSGTMTLVNIHPTPRSAQDHHDYAAYWLAEKSMFLEMRYAAGYIDPIEHASLVAELRSAYAKYLEEHPLPVKRSLRERIKEVLS